MSKVKGRNYLEQFGAEGVSFPRSHSHLSSQLPSEIVIQENKSMPAMPAMPFFDLASEVNTVTSAVFCLSLRASPNSVWRDKYLVTPGSQLGNGLPQMLSNN
jgi:hypothetical protein